MALTALQILNRASGRPDDYNINRPRWMLDAMEQYAKQQCIEFAEWIAELGFTAVQGSFHIDWIDSKDCYVGTTETVFEIFQQEQL
jgi:hypothetical protein